MEVMRLTYHSTLLLWPAEELAAELCFFGTRQNSVKLVEIVANHDLGEHLCIDHRVNFEAEGTDPARFPCLLLWRQDTFTHISEA